MKRLITRQSDVNDCGPAVIYSLVKYYKGYVSLERIKLDTHLDKTGISAYDMVLALNSYGFEAKGLKLDLEDLKKANRPLVLHCIYDNNFGHFILLLKVTKKKAIVMNPAIGIEKLSWEELAHLYSGVVIDAVPIGNIIHLKKVMTLKEMFKTIFKTYQKDIIAIILTGLLVNLIGIIISYYLKLITTWDNLRYLFITFLILCILKGLLSFYLQRKVLKTDTKIEYHFTSQVFNHLFLLPISNLELISKGRILKYINDLNLLKETILEFYLSIFLGLLELIFLLGLLFIINHLLLFFFLGLLIIYIFFKIISLNLNKNRLKDAVNSANTYQEALNETVSKVRMMKRLNKSYFLKKINRSLLEFLDNNKIYMSYLNNNQVLEEFFFDILNILSITISFILVKRSIISLVDLFIYITLSTYLLNTFKKVLELLPKFSYLEENYLYLSEFLALKEEETDAKIPFSNGNITFKNVSFTYNQNTYIIKNLNQVIKMKEKVIITGSSGNGKSTLVKLLYRFYEPSSGNILINGINISDYDLKSLRDNISYVSQDDTLFKGSLYENITLGEEVGLEDLNKVIKICKLDTLINKCPNHLETLILEDKTNFSGGEAMRIILARALLLKSDILILDEALSGVDEAMERKIVKDIIKEYPDKTLIYITHRALSSLFDKEIKLDK